MVACATHQVGHTGSRGRGKPTPGTGGKAGGEQSTRTAEKLVLEQTRGETTAGESPGSLAPGAEA